MTNATKANLIAVVNAVILCLQVFDVPINNAQQAAIGGVVNAICVAWIGMTYKDSHKRVRTSHARAGAAATTPGS